MEKAKMREAHREEEERKKSAKEEGGRERERMNAARKEWHGSHKPTFLCAKRMLVTNKETQPYA